MAAPMSDNVEEKEIPKSFTEIGITILQKPAKTPLDKSKQFNPRFSTIREAVLGTLKVVTKETESVLRCVDVLGASGIAGLQWKKHCGEAVHVTIVDKESTDNIKENCTRNEVTPKDLQLDFKRIPGDPMEAQSSTEVHVCHCGPNVILHMEAFEFIYLNTHGNFITYIDSAIANLMNNGILCLSSCDISSQFVRTPHMIHRQFSANANTKTDYTKELAVRIIIACIVRSAAKCNKGIEVLYCMCVDDLFLICVKILRGPKYADNCMEQIRNVLHCQMCEDRVFYPKINYPIEEPYKLLSCDCQIHTPGKTAVLLGPAWSGSLFNTSFLERVLSESQDCSQKLQNTLSLMIEESKCGQISHVTENGKDDAPPLKKLKSDVSLTNQMPAFYYNIPKRKFKGVSQPKLSQLIEVLHQEGYSVSHTHFDNNSIRTNSTIKQLYSVLQKYFSQKPKS